MYENTQPGRFTLRGNQLTNLNLPPDLANLNFLDLTANQLTSLTLPPDVTNLISLFLDGNPLTTFVLSEPLAATNLAPVVVSLQSRGIPVFTYPLTVQLVRRVRGVETISNSTLRHIGCRCRA